MVEFAISGDEIAETDNGPNNADKYDSDPDGIELK